MVPTDPGGGLLRPILFRRNKEGQHEPDQQFAKNRPHGRDHGCRVSDRSRINQEPPPLTSSMAALLMNSSPVQISKTGYANCSGADFLLLRNWTFALSETLAPPVRGVRMMIMDAQLTRSGEWIGLLAMDFA